MSLPLVGRAARALTAVGAVSLFLMLASTVIDILARSVTGRPLTGVFDFVEITVVLIVFCGLPEVFVRDEQIVVDLFDKQLGASGLAAVKLAAALATLVFLVLLAANAIVPALDSMRFGDRKPDLPVPIFALWIVILLNVASSIAAVVLCVVRLTLRLLARRSVP